VRTETATTVTLDFRPFGDRQGEEIDSYLHSALGNVQMGVGRFNKPVILLCDSKAVIPDSAHRWLANLNAKGVAITIQPTH
jgi:hypothetical protein